MMSKPVVSIIIPVYNVENYLEECLDSVLNQTFQDFEVIAINDGSKDRSLEILSQYQAGDRRITVVSQENTGQSASRNRGVEMAAGKYIYFLDADDYILPEALENLMMQMERHNLDLIRFAAEPFVDKGTDFDIYKRQYDFSQSFQQGKVYNKEEFLTTSVKAYSASPCLYVMKRELLVQNGIVFKTGILHEDEVFTLEVFLHTEKAMYDPNFYYKRRYRNDSVMTEQKAKHSQRSFDSYYEVIVELSKLLETHNDPTEVKLIKRRMGKLYGILANSQVSGDYKRKTLKTIPSISDGEKLYYNLRYKPQKYLRKLVFKYF